MTTCKHGHPGKSTGAKLLAAVAGGAAALALGMLGMSTSPAIATASSNSMKIGLTTIETTPPAAPLVAMAVPGITGNTPPAGFAVTHH